MPGRFARLLDLPQHRFLGTFVLAWPPPLSSRWTALALFLFALALHLFLAGGGTIIGIDFKTLILIDEIGAILAAPLLFAMLLGLRPGEAFLLRSTHWVHYVVAGVTAIPLQLFGGAMQEIVIESLPGSDAWRELIEQAMAPLLQAQTVGDMALLVLGGVVLAAVCEEILFRGLLFQLLGRGGRWRSAILISAVLFAVFHLDVIGLLPRTLMGIYFGLLVWRSGSIFPAMLAHGANNLLAFAAIPFIDDSAASPEPWQTVLLMVVAGVVFALMLAAYLRFTSPPQGPDSPFTDTAWPPPEPAAPPMPLAEIDAGDAPPPPPSRET